MSASLPSVTVNLWRADAIVLFDWPMGIHFEAVPIDHPAEKQALSDLLTALESQTEVPYVTQQEIDQARAEVAKDMGW